jgi:hypothetical protein
MSWGECYITPDKDENRDRTHSLPTNSGSGLCNSWDRIPQDKRSHEGLAITNQRVLFLVRFLMQDLLHRAESGGLSN